MATLKTTYSGSNHCRNCGLGLVQKEPFSLLKALKWGIKSILQSNWVYDEFFVRPEAYETIFKPFGIECKEVLNFKTKKPIRNILQLDIPDDQVTLQKATFEPYLCNQCGKIKYRWDYRGYFPPLKMSSSMPTFKTVEYFEGGGAAAYKEIIICKELCQKILSNKLKEVKFSPIASMFD